MKLSAGSRLGPDVAIKVLPSNLADAGRLRRFEKEARSASALNHPSIVTIFDVGSAESISYIAMELVEGKTLRELLFSGPLPVKKVLGLATQIADGLARAHEAGIVHRDLKPENLMPDGQTIVYSATWSGGTGRDLYLLRIGSPESRLLFPNTDLFSVSDSRELAVMPRGSTQRPSLLARVPLTGGAPREVLENVFHSNADWAPGGKALAAVRSIGGRNRLEFPIGRVIYESEAPISTPRFSRDGRRIAFFQSQNSVAAIDADGRNKKVLSSGWSSTQGAPCWAREEEILFAASRGTTSFTWLDRSRGVDLSADGKTILIDEWGEGGGPDSGVYLRPMSGAPAKHLGEGTAMALSPDGRWVIASRGGRAWLLPTGPGEPKTLGSATLQTFGGADWCPDGKRIVFSAREEGKRERLCLQTVSGGPPRAISPEGVSLLDFGGSVSPDGRLVVGFPAREQPELQRLGERGSAQLYALDGGPPRSIPGLREGERPVQWSSDGKSIFVYRRAEVPAKVWLLDTVTGRRRPWREIRHPDHSFQNVRRLLVAPDGGSYAYYTGRDLSALYLIEGLF